MITRAQAEALLTLAESLEACGRKGLNLMFCRENLVVFKSVVSNPSDGLYVPLSDYGLLNPEKLRQAVADLMPK